MIEKEKKNYDKRLMINPSSIVINAVCVPLNEKLVFISVARQLA